MPGADTDQVELACEERGAAVLRLAGIGRMVLKELALILEGAHDGLVSVNVLLTTVHHRHIAWPAHTPTGTSASLAQGHVPMGGLDGQQRPTEPQRHHAAREDVEHVGPFVHNVNLGEHTDGPLPYITPPSISTYPTHTHAHSAVASADA